MMNVPAERPLRTPSEIEERVSALRVRAIPPKPEPGSAGLIKTPDSIIRDLEEVSYLAGQMVEALHEADRTRAKAKFVLAKAEAIARQAATGKTIPEKEAEILLATEVEREAAEIAEIAYRYAKECSGLIESRKSAIQTQAKQVEITYQLAGGNRR